MIKAKKTDKKLICGLLSSAFSDNPSVNYIIAGEKQRTQRIYALMEYSFEQCMLFGEVWLSDDRKACGLLLFPQQKRTSLATIWLDLKLIFQAVGLSRLRKTLRRERLVEQKRPVQAMAYLWFIGVDPQSQNFGVGSELLGQILDHTAKVRLPVFLETSVARNLSWYERFDFRQYNDLDLGYHLFFMTNNE